MLTDLPLNAKIPPYLVCPTVPNFVRTKEGQWIDIARLSDDQLNRVAAIWRAKLIARARERQANPEPPENSV